MKTIGILGGLGPESTASYYTTITREYYNRYKNYAYPEIIIYSLNFQKFIDTGYELSEHVEKIIRKLYNAGADFVIAACNSVHIIYEQIADKLPIPWISIMNCTAEAIYKSKIKTVVLLGTIFTMNNDFYQKTLAKYDIKTMTPNLSVKEKINKIIYNELVRGKVREESRREVLHYIEELKSRGAQGVILGCTELPFLIRQQDVDIPVFDTTMIHSLKALELALT